MHYVSYIMALLDSGDATVVELISFSGDRYFWNINFSRSVLDWELGLVSSFTDLLYYGLWKGDGVGELWWKPASRGIFYIKSY